jgi:hypothetical protein
MRFLGPGRFQAEGWATSGHFKASVAAARARNLTGTAMLWKTRARTWAAIAHTKKAVRPTAAASPHHLQLLLKDLRAAGWRLYDWDLMESSI